MQTVCIFNSGAGKANQKHIHNPQTLEWLLSSALIFFFCVAYFNRFFFQQPVTNQEKKFVCSVLRVHDLGGNFGLFTSYFICTAKRINSPNEKMEKKWEWTRLLWWILEFTASPIQLYCRLNALHAIDSKSDTIPFGTICSAALWLIVCIHTTLHRHTHTSCTSTSKAMNKKWILCLCANRGNENNAPTPVASVLLFPWHNKKSE